MQRKCKPRAMKFTSIAEVQPFLCKENANREQNEINAFISYAEVQPFLCKESANREQNEMNAFISYAEVQPFLCKDTLFIETTIEMVAN